MARITTTILVALLLVNGAATAMEASGLSDDLGVSTSTGISEEMDSVIDTMKDGFQPDTTIVESLLSTLVAAGSLFTVVLRGVTAAPILLSNLGFPDWIIGLFFAPSYLIGTLELVSILAGRRTT